MKRATGVAAAKGGGTGAAPGASAERLARIWRTVAAIPRGSVSTYGGVAARADFRAPHGSSAGRSARRPPRLRCPGIECSVPVAESSSRRAAGISVNSAGASRRNNNAGLIPNPTISYANRTSTATLTYIPTIHRRGSAVITVTAADNGGIANGGVNTISQQFTVTIMPVNQPPTINLVPNPAPSTRTRPRCRRSISRASPPAAATRERPSPSPPRATTRGSSPTQHPCRRRPRRRSPAAR